MSSRKIIALLAAILLGLVNLKAQTTTWEIWGGDNAIARKSIPSNLQYNAGGTTIVLLEGDIEVQGKITVDNGTTLRILNLTGVEHTIKNGTADVRTKPLFEVIGTAKLAFNYIDTGFNLLLSDSSIYKTVTSDGAWSNMTEGNAKYAPIILDGGTTWNTNGGEEFYEETVDGATKRVLSPSNSVCFDNHTGMIESFGALELFKVNIRNYYAIDHFGIATNDRSGVIMLAPRKVLNRLAKAAVEGAAINNYTVLFRYRYTHLKCCVVEKCKSRTGLFLSIDTATGNYQDYDGVDGGLTYRYKLNTDNYPPNSDDCRIEVENCTIRKCVVFGDKDGWGGLIRCKGGSAHCLTLTNTTFENNFSHGDGAGLWWNAGGHSTSKCVINGCTFRNNRAMRNAGAMRMEGIFEFTGNKTVVTGNECLGLQRDSTLLDQKYIPCLTGDKGNGGGMHIYGYGSDAYEVGGNLVYSLSDLLEVTDNYAAGQGGGIAFDFTAGTKLTVGTTITADFRGLKVVRNRAGMDGGGIYFNNTAPVERNYTFNIQLNAGTIEENEASQGGGISANNVDISYNKSYSYPVTISNNRATAGSGGGVCLIEGSITLDLLNITGNTSRMEEVPDGVKYGGGGVYVRNGSFNIETGLIQGNTSGMYGGGVFVYNESTEANTIQLAGGDIKQNEALYGGGLAAYGDLELTIQDVNVENNSAYNGGGIFLRGVNADGPAKLNYKSGIIRYNLAKANDGQILETAYGLSHNEMSGMGGGFYIGSFAELAFAAPEDFGIYSNLADNGADDLFGYYSNVKITLPDVQKLNLAGFEGGSISNLFWGEDYITNDTNYDKGLKLKGAEWDSDKTNQRFRDVFINNEGRYYTIVFDEGEASKVYENKYLCLTLIWHEDYLLLVKKGMKMNENAIFNVYKVDGSGNENLYVSVMLTDADADESGDRLKKITLKNVGIYKIVELPWAWAYDVDQSEILKVIGQNSSEEERTFTFTNTPKESAPIHDESLKINHM